jgi:hypothetical protein
MVVARAAPACLALVMSACSHPVAPVHGTGGSDGVAIAHAEPLAADAPAAPRYREDELDRVLVAERSAITKAEQELAARADDPQPDDQLPAAVADLRVRRRFVASLERCRATGDACPPRLDDPAWSYDLAGAGDPPLDTPLRYDLDDWRKIAAELHGRACACRTIACVDSLAVAIDVLDRRPMPDVAGDDAAVASVTNARECLHDLRR